MKKIINFVKQLENNKIIDKLNIDEDFQDDIRFDKGLIKFWVYEENPKTNEYYIQVYKCEHKKNPFKEGINGVMLYDRTLCEDIVQGEDEIIKLIKEYVKETNHNEQRVEFLQGRINKLTEDLSNKELCEKYPKISNSKRKKLEQFKNDLIIATNFYKGDK